MLTRESSILVRLLTGAGAGLVGTVALQPVRTLSGKYLPGTTPPMRQNPGEFMVHQGEQLAESTTGTAVAERVPETLESATVTGLSFDYGMTFGTLYGLACTDDEPVSGSIWADGVVLGVITWAVGFLGWLPASGLTPPVWKQSPQQVAGSVMRHAFFGLVTAAVFHWLNSWLND